MDRVCVKTQRTRLKGRNDVSLDGIAVSFGNSIHSKVSNERVESHCATNHSSVIAHLPIVSTGCATRYAQRLNLLARADIEAIRAMRWILQLRTSEGSNVPDA